MVIPTRSVEPEAVRRVAGEGPLLAVADDVFCLQLSIVNVFFSGRRGAGDRGWVLIDAGLYASAGAIRRAASDLYGRDSRPAAIVLTHGHFDHVGVVRELADLWDAPVFAHRMELPYLTGQSDYPPPDPTVGGGMMARLAMIYPKKAIDLRPRISALPNDGSVPAMPGWHWIHTPGHTPGHVSLWREEDGVLIAGDAFVTTKQESAFAVLTQPAEVRRPPAYFTPDWVSAARSVRELAALRPNVAATGHGKPMYGEEMRRQLDALAANFEAVAIPAKGRYVHEPAKADETGVVSVPPPVKDPLPLVLAGAGALAFAALLLRGRGRKGDDSPPPPQGPH